MICIMCHRLFWKWEDHPNVIPADEIKESEKSANIFAALKDLGYENTNAFVEPIYIIDIKFKTVRIINCKL